MMLTAKRVHEIYEECLFTDEEVRGDHVPEGAVVGEGVLGKAAFHPERLREREQEVSELLRQLPDEFMASKGGGWSFLNMCVTRDGVHWAEHSTMDLLVQLGSAVGAVKCLLPRDAWPALPGGMPYYQVVDVEAPDGDDEVVESHRACAAAAARWWRRAVERPSFDNGDPLHGSVARICRGSKPLTDEATMDRLEEALERRFFELLARRNGRAYAAVDYHPDEVLADAQREAGLDGPGLLTWPWKTRMRIEGGEVRVRAGYGAEEQVVYPADAGGRVTD